MCMHLIRVACHSLSLSHRSLRKLLLAVSDLMNITIDDMILDDAVRRAVDAEDRLRDANEKIRVLSIQLGALKAQLKESATAATRAVSTPQPIASTAVEAAEAPIVHSPNHSVSVHKLRVVEQEFTDRCHKLEARVAALEAELKAAREQLQLRVHDARIQQLDADVLRQQVTELSARNAALAAQNAALERARADLQLALEQMSEQVERLSVQTIH